MAPTSDAVNANTTVNANGRKICEASPSTNTTGTNTAAVVSVEAITAGPNSEAPWYAAFNR